jgi:hypothetical protein
VDNCTALTRLSPHIQEVSLDLLDEVSGGEKPVKVETTGKVTVKNGTTTIEGGTTVLTF